MKRLCIAALVALISLGAAHGQSRGAASTVDPFVLSNADFPPADSASAIPGPWQTTAGLTFRSPAIDPTKKTLVIIAAGQSLNTNINPTSYVPTNSSVVDQLNVYDGALYNVPGPMLGPSTANKSPYGMGTVIARLADGLIGTFDRVIAANVTIGGSSLAMWATGNSSNRLCVTMKRFAALGITPVTTGVTFAIIWSQGETDFTAGTTSAVYQAGLNTILTNVKACGFSGRFFVNRESSVGDTTSGTYLGQGAVVDNVNFWAGTNYNSIPTGSRVDGTHFNDTGAATAASAVITAMHASGAPFYWQQSCADNDNVSAAEFCKAM
jgi:hypothetical protein